MCYRRLRIRNLLETAELQQKLREQNTMLASNLSDRTTELEEARIESVERLALMAELRDDVTGQHNARVAGIARQIAEAIGPRSELAKLIGRSTTPLLDGLRQAVGATAPRTIQR